MPNIAALAPMPSPSVMTTPAVNAGRARRPRRAYVLGGFLLEVEAQLGVELLLQRAAVDERAEAVAQVDPEFGEHRGLSPCVLLQERRHDSCCRRQGEQAAATNPRGACGAGPQDDDATPRSAATRCRRASRDHNRAPPRTQPASRCAS